MALIKCPECGKEVSDKAKECIHCGYPLKNHDSVKKSYSANVTQKVPISTTNSNKTKKGSLGCGTVIAIIAAIIILLGIFGGDSDSSGSSSNYGEVRCWYCGKVIYNDGRAIHCTNEYSNTYTCDYCDKSNVIK